VDVSVTGKVKNGAIVLPPGIKLSEGAEVKVETLDLLPESDPRIAEILKLAKPRPHWPKDFALNHAHYAKRHPKKA
jgi:hypothetical protein